MTDEQLIAELLRRFHAPAVTGARTEPPPAPVAGLTPTEARAIAVDAVRLYAETHPRPPHVTQTQAAEMLGLSRATVHRLVHAGGLRLNRAGLIPIGEVDRLLATDRG